MATEVTDPTDVLSAFVERGQAAEEAVDGIIEGQRRAHQEYLSVSIDSLALSPLNPRQRFDQAGLDELAASIREHGVLEPLLVRPWPAGRKAKVPAAWEIVAGARRFRAATLARLAEVPVRVKQLSDREVLEVQVIENLQREGLHPLEEAQGYEQLMKKGGYDVAKIAARVGRSVKYVYDRVKLLGLRKELKDVFSDGEITAGHAILLARLKADEQKQCLDRGLFTGERYLFDPERDHRAKDPRKPVSVRELQSWIDEHVRFDQAQPDPMLFPETALALEEAKRIIPITHSHYIQEEAREGRTFGPRSWKRADGQRGSKTCDRAVTGIIVVGPGRGDAFKVCVNKEKCKVHWGAEHRAKKKRAAVGAAGAAIQSNKRWEAERQKREAEEKRWEKAVPAIARAVAERVKVAPAGATGPLAQLLVDFWNPHLFTKGSPDLVPRGKSAEDLVRHLAYLVLKEEMADFYDRERFIKRAKALGVDVAKVLAAESPAEKKAEEEKPAKAKRAKAKK